jgi:hypothetical protein
MDIGECVFNCDFLPSDIVIHNIIKYIDSDSWINLSYVNKFFRYCCKIGHPEFVHQVKPHRFLELCDEYSAKNVNYFNWKLKLVDINNGEDEYINEADVLLNLLSNKKANLVELELNYLNRRINFKDSQMEKLNILRLWGDNLHKFFDFNKLKNLKEFHTLNIPNKKLSKLINLEKLVIWSFCDGVPKLPKLKSLVISYVDNEAFKNLPNLESLILSQYCCVTDEGFRHLSHLKLLDLSKNDAKNRFTSKLFDYCPNIEFLKLSEHCNVLENKIEKLDKIKVFEGYQKWDKQYKPFVQFDIDAAIMLDKMDEQDERWEHQRQRQRRM